MFLRLAHVVDCKSCIFKNKGSSSLRTHSSPEATGRDARTSLSGSPANTQGTVCDLEEDCVETVEPESVAGRGD